MRTLRAYFATSLHRKLIAAMTAAIATVLAPAAWAFSVAEAPNTRRLVTSERQSLARAHVERLWRAELGEV